MTPNSAADRALIHELASCRYLESATNVLLIGPPGTGSVRAIGARDGQGLFEEQDGLLSEAVGQVYLAGEARAVNPDRRGQDRLQTSSRASITSSCARK